MATRTMAIIRLFMLGVALGVVLTDQSDTSMSSEEQMEGAERRGRIDTPAVVLQLKYDRGELNRIYLAQFRKGNTAWVPSVAARSDLCTDLCHAGLGGEACGVICEDLMPVGLKSVLTNSTTAAAEELYSSDVTYGEPRVDVCPALCKNQLGEPLCNCAKDQQISSDVEWSAVCQTFCVSNNYVLRGCPTCDQAGPPPLHLAKFHSLRTLSTSEGWVMWCNVQCRQGHGGAACNCDRSPL